MEFVVEKKFGAVLWHDKKLGFLSLNSEEASAFLTACDLFKQLKKRGI